MKTLMQHKGYFGSIEYDADEPIFYGKLEFIKALISYEAKDAKGIQCAFHEAVDDYLQMCEQQNLKPEHPFKGTFNIRTGHELHKKIALAAAQRDISINKFICNVLNRECQNSLRG